MDDYYFQYSHNKQKENLMTIEELQEAINVAGDAYTKVVIEQTKIWVKAVNEITDNMGDVPPHIASAILEFSQEEMTAKVEKAMKE